MDKEIFPAIITAIAGIIGIIFNICINTIYRMVDNHDKRRTQKIESLEIYYVPLSNKMQILNRLINTYEKLSKEKVSMEKLLNFCNETERVPANQRKIFDEIKSMINELYDFMHNNQHHYLNDFKTRFYFNKINHAINMFRQAIDNKSTYQNDKFSFIYIAKLINRINIMTISLYSLNIFHFIYLKIWVNKEIIK